MRGENADGVSHDTILALPFLSCPRQLYFALGIVLPQADPLRAWVPPAFLRVLKLQEEPAAVSCERHRPSCHAARKLRRPRKEGGRERSGAGERVRYRPASYHSFYNRSSQCFLKNFSVCGHISVYERTLDLGKMETIT